MIAETVASVRERLPRAEILVGCDGVPDHLAHRTADYDEYLRRLAWACCHEWDGWSRSCSTPTRIRWG